MNARWLPWLRGAGLALLAAAWTVAAHFTSATGESSGWGAGVALAPLGAALVMGLWRLPSRWLASVAALGVTALLVWLWPVLKSQVALLYYVQHLGIYCLLAAFFGRSLFGPGESLVTQMARSVHGGQLSHRQMVYTRKVTVAWTLFFAGMALVSSALFVMATAKVWSTFANLLGAPLIALMFLGEFLWRQHALPDEQRSTLAATVRAWRARQADQDRAP
jgi:uncharacterized membrane protein